LHSFKAKGATKAYKGIEGKKVVEREGTYEIRLKNKDRIHEVWLYVKREPEGFLSSVM